jgi:hypothetical protein
VPRSFAPRGEEQFKKWFYHRLIVRADGVQHERPNGAAVTPTPNAPPPVPKAMKPVAVVAEVTVNEAAGTVAVTVTHPESGASVTTEPATVYPNEGCIEHAGRGWYNVHYKGETKKVRNLEAAQTMLSEWRGDPPIAQLQPGDEVVDGETGEITTVPGEPATAAEEFPTPPNAPDSVEADITGVFGAEPAVPGIPSWEDGDGPDEDSPRNPTENPYGEGVF